MEEDRYKILLEAIEEERKSEEQYFAKLAVQKTDAERVASGVMLTALSIKKIYYTIGEFVEIQLIQNKPNPPFNKLKTGVGIVLSAPFEGGEDFKGTVSYKRKDEIGVIISSDAMTRDQLPMTGLYKLAIVYDERPYKVMREAIVNLMSSKEEAHIALREGVRKLSALDSPSYDNPEQWFLPRGLNDTQEDTIRNILDAGQMGIIHGPPGTGKTTTLVALIQTLLKKEKKILVCAPSNNAVDLLAGRLDAQGVNVVRIGNVTRIDDAIAGLTLDAKAVDHPEWKHVKEVRIEAEAARRMAETRKRKFGTDQRANRSAMFKESKELIKWARDIQNRVISDVLRDAQVIATTLVGASNSQLEGIAFETVIIDEASQCLEPECWNAILKAKRVFLAGDHLQLPPTVKSPQAQKLGFETTLLDRMTPYVKHHYLLEVQYRMNDAILGFSNVQFYDGLLKSDPSNAHWSLQGDEHPLVFIDTSGCGYEEELNPKTQSISNKGEYFVMREHLLAYFEMYLDAEIGVVSPYAEQARYIRDEIEGDDQLRALQIHVDTIDGFQGQERDIILISLARSNDEGNIGFLADFRRLNVALTRAKKKLVIIGDGSTLSSNPLYLKLIEHVETNGYLQSAWEYML